MFKNIILTGFMGVGKTSVGTGLARDLGFAFIDTDGLIEADQGRTIAAIFAENGEPYFRDVETRVIKGVLDRDRQVLSTGGGAVIREENREAFRAAGLTVCLTARPEVIYDRVRHERHRPLLQVPDPPAKIRELLAERDRFYRQADFVVDTSDKTIEQVIDEIKERVRYACC
jgi:shikimate kinase